MSNRRARLVLEALEHRLVPSATARALGGTLIITEDNTSNNLTLTTNVGGTIQVTNGTTNLGTFTATSVNVTTGNAADTVSLNLAAADLNGSLFIKAGNGGDLVNVDGGAVRGAASILGGAGSDSFNVGANATAGFRGGLTINGGLGNDVLTVSNGSSVQGTLSVTNVPVLDLGLGSGTVTFNNISVSEATENVAVHLDLGSLLASVPATVTGSFSYTGGSGSNTVEFEDGSIAGTTTVNSTSGAAVLAVLEVTLDGLNYTGGPAGTYAAFALLGTTPTINGNVSLNMGSGTNQYDLGDTGSPFTVNGNMTITAGNGSNNIGTFGGTVYGNLTFTLGNGTDSATVVNAPSGLLRWTSGNGNDALTLGTTTSPSQAWDVNLRFGNGDDTLTLAATGIPQIITGSADGGGSVTGNTFSQSPDWTLSNFQLANFS